jgi:hypothetical protein
MTDPTTPPPGWYPDAQNATSLRWWNGTAWTEDRSARAAFAAAPSGLRSVGDFIGDAFKSVGRAAKPLLVLAAIAIVPLMVALFLADAQLGFTDWLDEVVEVAEQADPGQTIDFPSWDVNGASAAIWGLTILLLYLFAFAVLPLAAVPLIEGDPDLDGAMRAGLRATPRAIGVGLLAALGFGVLLLVPLIALAMFPPLGVLAFLAVIPFAIFLSVRLLVLYQPLIMIEGLGFGLFGRSWALTRGHFWGLFGRSVLFGLIVSIATNVVTFPFQFIGAADPQLGTVVSVTVGVAVGAASGLVQVSGPLVLYRDLVDGPPGPGPAPVWGQSLRG